MTVGSIIDTTRNYPLQRVNMVISTLWFGNSRVVDTTWEHPFDWHPDVLVDLFGSMYNSKYVSQHNDYIVLNYIYNHVDIS